MFQPGPTVIHQKTLKYGFLLTQLQRNAKKTSFIYKLVCASLPNHHFSIRDCTTSNYQNMPLKLNEAGRQLIQEFHNP